MIEPGLYQHFKGNKYLALGIAKHTETNEELVIYMLHEKQPPRLFARPIAMFEEEVNVEGMMVPRFKFIESL